MKTVIGNWKMEVGTRESIALARGTLIALRGKKTVPTVVVCPPYVALSELRKVVARSSVALGAQDVFWMDQGAYTGEVSARMLEEHGVSHVIVGHSERRSILGETDEMVNKKAATALGHGLIPVICVGETEDQRSDAREVVRKQVETALEGLRLRPKDSIMFAYEPIWAIGTGVSAEPRDVLEMHSFIRDLAQEHLGDLQNGQLSVLYGGSVTPENAYAFMREKEVDGVLVGGASVRMNQFANIISAAMDVMEGQSA